MRIGVKLIGESVVFTLPNGDVVEIIMINAYGEDADALNDVKEAFRILKDELKYFESALVRWHWGGPHSVEMLKNRAV